jgi:hypothetical protein
VGLRDERRRVRQPALRGPGAGRLALALSAAALAAAAAAAPAHAAAPPVLTAVQWTLRATVGFPAGFIARAVDPDGDAVTIGWAFDDGTTAAGPRVTKVWTTPGPHTARVTATDATGLRTVDDLALEVLPFGATPGGAPPAAGNLPRPGPAPVSRVLATTTALRLRPTGTVAVRLRCARGADCAGTVSIARGGRRLAATRYDVRAGRAKTVGLRVPARTARALRRRPARRLAVVLTVAPEGGRPVRADATLRLR